jgi:hypothetical protein
VLHGWVCLMTSASSPSHVLTRLCCPPPHGAEHGDQLDHSVHPMWDETTYGGGGSAINEKWRRRAKHRHSLGDPPRGHLLFFLSGVTDLTPSAAQPRVLSDWVDFFPT